MVMVDWQIKAARQMLGLVVEPWEPEEFLQGHSLDVRLGYKLRVAETEIVIDIPDEGVEMRPGDFWLGSTLEYFVIPDNMIMSVEGKSSLGRQGLFTHVTAGHVEGGFKGEITLELHKIGLKPILLTPGMRIAQMKFTHTEYPERPYGHPKLNSKYMGQIGPTPARP